MHMHTLFAVYMNCMCGRERKNSDEFGLLFAKVTHLPFSLAFFNNRNILDVVHILIQQITFIIYHHEIDYCYFFQHRITSCYLIFVHIVESLPVTMPAVHTIQTCNFSRTKKTPIYLNKTDHHTGIKRFIKIYL